MTAESPIQADPPRIPPAGGRKGGSPRHSLRRLVESIVVLLVALLFIRTFTVEAYIVPTGSMAPALIGYYKTASCPECGAPVVVGRRERSPSASPEENQEEADRNYRRACCPNCGCYPLNLDQAEECQGDRLLVHKHVFELREPKRWELVVFRSPEHDQAADTIIKRLVGLPGEKIQLREGDIYVNDAMLRKTLPEFKMMRLLAFDNQYIPQDACAPFRWSWLQSSTWQASDAGRQFRLRVGPAKDHYHWLYYRHMIRDHTANPMVWREEDLKDVTGYNGGQSQDNPVHDLMLECDVRAGGSGWLALAITDGHDDVLIEMPVGSQAGVTRFRHVTAQRFYGTPDPRGFVPFSNKPDTSRDTSSYRLPEGKTVHVEFGLVDRRLFLTVDGVELFAQRDLPSPQPPFLPRTGGDTRGVRREPLRRPLALGGRGPVSIGGKGLPLEISNLRLYRDIHYTEREGGMVHPHGVVSPVVLGPEEYFVLGDNSPNSYDSRRWKLKHPVVRQENLVGKAFLLHLPTRPLECEFNGAKHTVIVPDWQRARLLP